MPHGFGGGSHGGGMHGGPGGGHHGGPGGGPHGGGPGRRPGGPGGFASPHPRPGRPFGGPHPGPGPMPRHHRPPRPHMPLPGYFHPNPLVDALYLRTVLDALYRIRDGYGTPEDTVLVAAYFGMSPATADLAACIYYLEGLI